MANQVMSGQGTSQFLIQPSDTLDIIDDSNNTKDFGFCYVHNPSAGGTLRVLAVDDTAPQTVYIAQGGTYPVAVKRVYNTSPAPPANLVAICSKTKV